MARHPIGFMPSQALKHCAATEDVRKGLQQTGRAQKTPMKPIIPTKLRMERKSPDFRLPNEDRCTLEPGQNLDIPSRPRDPGSPDKTGLEGPPFRTVDLERGFKGFRLSSIVVPPHRNVEEPHRDWIAPSRGPFDSLGDKDKASARREDAHPLPCPCLDRVTQIGYVKEFGERRTLPSGQDKRLQSFKILWGVYQDRTIVPQKSPEHTKMLRDIPLKS